MRNHVSVSLRPLFFTAALLSASPALLAEAPPDKDWPANSILVDAESHTIAGLGAAQGVTVFGDKIYLYGDVYAVKPRIGVVREYGLDLQPTGRVVWLRKGGKPLLTHPTGLTFDDSLGVWLGDTVGGKSFFHRLDWERAWKDGDLEHAVLASIPDDAAVNGGRPCFVTVGGRRLLATADYGERTPAIRLIDVRAMLAAGRTAAPGVVVHRVACGPFNQNLDWDARTGRLTCIQNVVAGWGWRLDVVDLSKAVAAGSTAAAGVRIQRWTLPAHTELEGYSPLADGRSLFITSHRSENVWIGRLRKAAERTSVARTQTPR